jgi:prepilin peptidase CpaA
MTASVFIQYVPLLALLAVACGTDLRNRRIPNWLTFTIVLAGLVQSFTPIGTVGPMGSALGMLSGFGLTFVLFALGALGGGDVKLMAGVGAWIGPGPTLAVFAVTSLIGMVIVLVQALWHGRLRNLLLNTTVLTINLVHLQDVGIEHAQATGQSCRSIDRPLPYAVPVLLAVLMILAQH